MKNKIISFMFLFLFILTTYAIYILTNSYYNTTYYNVTITPSENHLSLPVGSPQQTCNVVLKNNTRKVIYPKNNIFLSYHLYDSSHNKLKYDNDRSDINTLNPYSTNDVKMKFDVPNKKGNYILAVDLVEEGVTWFSKKNNPIAEISLEVK